MTDPSPGSAIILAYVMFTAYGVLLGLFLGWLLF